MIYYRIEDKLVSDGVDQFDNPLGSRLKLEVYKFDVIKETPKGVQINSFERRRFILLSARKKYACRNLKEAKESFRSRKIKQIKILTQKIRNAQEAIELLGEIKE